jgi:hypothetical protein
MKWDIDTSEAVMWVAAEAGKSLTNSMKHKCGIAFTENINTVENDFFQWCTLEKEEKKVGKFLVERFKNKNFSEKFVKEYSEFIKISIKTLNELDKKDFSKLKKDELFEDLKTANDIYIENFDFGFIIEPMDKVMPEMIESRLKRFNYTIEEVSDILAIADIIFLNLETQKLIEIAKQPQEKQKELLKKHAYEYRWLWSAHLGRKDIPFSYFEEKLEEEKKKDLDKELSKLKNSKNNVIKRKEELLYKKPVDKEAKELLDIVDIIAPLHDRRKELFLRSIYTEDTVRQEIAKDYGYSLKELSVFQIEDIFKLKDGKDLDKNYAKEMLNHGILYINTKKNIWKYIYMEKKQKNSRKKSSQ